MKFSWRNRRGGGKKVVEGNSDVEPNIPTLFRCPISLDLMKDPVILPTGITYDRECIEKWIDEGNQTCPVTNQEIRTFDQIPNHTLRRMIQDWCVKNKPYGIERIPTPRIPVTPWEVTDVCVRIKAATQRGDEGKCQELLGKIKRWAKESDRNKKCIAENGVGCVLAASFDAFASLSKEKHARFLEDILRAVTWMFPLGEEGQSKLGSMPSLRCMAWFLKSEDLSTRQNAVFALKELLFLDQENANNFAEIEGVAESLFKIVKMTICSNSIKASLMVIYYMTSSSTSEEVTSKFLEMGLLSWLLDILVIADRSICERALGVLDNMCNSDEGREKARSHALAIPVLVKKILRASDIATDFAVSILWKLCKNECGNALVDALQFGAFQKLLVVLQVGCGDRTKEKATELLKLMNQYRDRLDSFDSSIGLKHLKKSC